MQCFLRLAFWSLLLVDIIFALPFRQNNSGVKLQGREKVHGDGEKCPTNLLYCKCKSKKVNIDITCEDITTAQLKVDADEIKKQEHIIRYFNIRNCNIPRLDDHIFMGMKIEHLLVHNCKLKSLGPNSISSQGNTMSHLVLSKNQLSEIPTDAIRHLKNLDHLNLNDNELVAIRAHAFAGLSKVTRLTLYNNKIHRIDSNAFDGLTKDMARLNLGRNRLDKIPTEALSNLKYLEILDLTENEISKIEPGDFRGLDSLDALILNYNHISHLGPGMFSHLTKLSSLYLDHNQIREIHFGCNLLQNELNLFRTIHPEAFTDLEATLQSLSMTSNLVEEFPSTALRPIHELRTLHLNENKISAIREDAFEGFGEHIKYLWLQDNMIKDIPATAFQDLHSLEWIKLYNNLLTTLHYELMEPVLDTLMHIDIHSNPLICDCELRWYRQWIVEEWNEVEQEWLKDTYCLNQADKKQHNIAKVSLKDMYCTSQVKDKPSARTDGGGAQSITCYLNTFSLTLVTLIITTTMQKKKYRV